ncbi:MAG: outer membrane beta-barrel protein [Bacteroidota bacterium]
MKPIRDIFMSMLLVVVLCSANIAAQQELGKPGLGFGPQVGFYKAGDADDGRFMFGVALRARLNMALGVEASINYRQEEYGNGAVAVRSWPVMVTGMFFPIPIVYGAIGAGWYNTSYDYSNDLKNLPDDVTKIDLSDETRQEFGWHLGAGLEIPVGGSLRITGDFKYVFLEHKFKDFAQTAVNNDLSSNFYVISAGILFGF